ncbi:recombinase family protein [Thalassotalea euphylliae]|uniref:recombinase family protein n=1 Tax=Thalassotalea euphylliae TaxID=1655234 RepID=UPI003630345E
MTVYGYARTSTIEQQYGLEAQIEQLNTAGADVLYQEQVSSVAARPKLDTLMANIEAGDKLVVTKLDRLARSVADLGLIVKELELKKADLHILDMNIDTSTASGKLMLNVLGSVAQFEREMMLERQKEGIAKAKAEGKYKGRQPTKSDTVAEVERMIQEGNLKPAEIMKLTGVGKTTFYKIKKSM